MYPLTNHIEARLVLAITTVPRVWKLIGAHIDPKKLANPVAQHIVLVLRQLNKKQSCSETAAVLQYLHWQEQQGKVLPSVIGEVHALFQGAEDTGGVGDLDSLLGAIVPMLRHDGHQVALDQAVKAFAAGGAPEDAAAALHKVSGIGSQSISLGHEAEGGLDDIVEAATSTLIDPLPTGIVELDIMMQGGLEKGAIGMFLAETGAGKSLALCHVAADAILSCRDIVFTTLELPEAQIRQRIYCNLLDMTPTEMAGDPQEAVRRYGLLRRRPEGVGRWIVKYFTPRVSTVTDLVTLLKDLRTERNLDCDLFCVDYEGKLGAKQSYGNSTYQERGEVMEDLRGVVDPNGAYRLCKWLWTASQANRGGKHRNKKLTVHDVAESMQKANIADAVVALYRTEEDQANGDWRLSIPKRRNAPAHGEVGPLPLDASRWRMTAVNRQNPW